MDLISVVVPVYNVEDYLQECLDSLINQTYKNLEIILVDDGSTDKSKNICDAYAEKHDNVVVIHKINNGLGMARNTGLGYVTGEYVMFLDSDDYLDLTLIEILYNAIKEKDADVCKSGFRKVTDTGKILYERKYKNEFFNKNCVTSNFLPRMIGSAPDKKDSIEMSVCASLYRVSHIKRHNIMFLSEREIISEDLMFQIEYMQYANSAYIVSHVGYNYRTNINSLTKKYRNDKFEDCMKFYFYTRKRLFELNYDEETMYRLDRITFIKVKGCISQEKFSKNSFLKIIRNIRSMCNDVRLQTIIKKYPINELGYKQKIFMYMLKYKQSFLLYICMKLGLIV